MKTSRLFHIMATLLLASMLGCSSTPKSPQVSDRIRTSLRQAGLQDVSVSQDVDKGVVTLSGNVPSEADKAQAEAIAKSIAGEQVVSDQIAVRPPGDENTAKKIDSALDEGIGKNLDAALIQRKLEKDVKYDVKNGVVTLKGEVRSQATRDVVEKLARTVPNVQQVVNELQVKNQKASSSD